MFTKMKKVSQVSIASIMMLVLLMSVPFTTLASSNERDGVKIKLNGVEAQQAPLHIKNGRVFLPVGVIVPLMSGAVNWDQENSEATITSKHDDEIVFADDVPTVLFNGVRYELDAAPYLQDGRLFVPARHVAQFLHVQINWDQENEVFSIDSVPLAKVTEENSVERISEEHEVELTVLLNRNGYKTAEEVKLDSEIAFIIPDVLSHKAVTYTEAEFNLLAKLVQVESGYEDYEGQLAVANVILNRVKSGKFPSSIKDVIYSGKQFPPAHNGLLDKSTPNKSVLKATRDAMNGKNNVGDAVYFHNPKVSSGSFWTNLDTVAVIGNHRFAK